MLGKIKEKAVLSVGVWRKTNNLMKKLSQIYYKCGFKALIRRGSAKVNHQIV